MLSRTFNRPFTYKIRHGAIMLSAVSLRTSLSVLGVSRVREGDKMPWVPRLWKSEWFAWLVAGREAVRQRRALYEEAMRRRELERFVRKRDMVTLFQPIVRLADGVTAGYEVLNRPPVSSSFPNAEVFYHYVGQSTQVFAVERSCRETALCRFAEQVREAPDLRHALLFLNIHPQVILDPSFRAGHTLRLVEDYGFSPSQIVLELTERGAIEDYGRFARLLHHYRSQGFRVAVDDAGTGYNSLQTLVYLQPEFLKLDRFLVRGIAGNPAARRMVALLLDYARESGTRVIGEGIETAEEYACLGDMGVDLGQGYFIGRPQPRAVAGQVPSVMAADAQVGAGG
ncbi:EAL domain-containing protein [Kyrpidia tusciae]|uniref:Diguanylate phosphodiesterase n=1 Tax=Kyrpidia tusciae (strain DSM 2912 / NBRC 15312 / T2) TaxID=562970 RepID=D5WVX8_KYRT2|nr:EAL domain-containing protein [Kyrpidia tusciae]ADG05610.1 diguanylate phosphodiesterase [Kyrpidia tusciae DSM 2912]